MINTSNRNVKRVKSINKKKMDKSSKHNKILKLQKENASEKNTHKTIKKTNLGLTNR